MSEVDVGRAIAPTPYGFIGFQQENSSTPTTDIAFEEGASAEGNGDLRTKQNMGLAAEMEQQEVVPSTFSLDVNAELEMPSNISHGFSELDENGNRNTSSNFVAPIPAKDGGCMHTELGKDGAAAIQLQNIEPSRSPLNARAELEEIPLHNIDSLSKANEECHGTACSGLPAQDDETLLWPERLNEQSVVESEIYDNAISTADWLEVTHAMLGSDGQNEQLR